MYIRIIYLNIYLGKKQGIQNKIINNSVYREYFFFFFNSTPSL